MNQFIVSCEHGGNYIPNEYQYLFNDAEEDLSSHRGWDPGALLLAKYLEKNLEAPLFFETKSRLLIELNRSLNHPSLFSVFTKNLSSSEKEKIIQKYYLPYRKKVENSIKSLINQNKSVIHLSIHSFIPVLNGKIRNCDIGLLYDPKIKKEKEFCWLWKKSFKERAPNWKIRMNYPYKGTSDGFTVYLRKRFQSMYSGIELEVNQALFQNGGKNVNRIIVESLKDLR